MGQRRAYEYDFWNRREILYCADKIRDSGDALPAQTEKSQQDIQKPGDENKEMTEEEKKAVLDSINKSLTELSKANELDSTIKLNIIGKNPNKRTVSMNVLALGLLVASDLLY